MNDTRNIYVQPWCGYCLSAVCDRQINITWFLGIWGILFIYHGLHSAHQPLPHLINTIEIFSCNFNGLHLLPCNEYWMCDLSMEYANYKAVYRYYWWLRRWVASKSTNCTINSTTLISQTVWLGPLWTYSHSYCSATGMYLGTSYRKCRLYYWG